MSVSTVRVYFDPKDLNVREVQKGNNCALPYLDETYRVTADGGVYYMDVPYGSGTPSAIEGKVTQCTFLESIHCGTCPTPGIYQANKSKVIVRLNMVGGNTYTTVYVTGPSPDEVIDLYEEVRSMTMTPTKSWEVNPLAQENEELRNQLDSLRESIKATSWRNFCAKVKSLLWVDF